LLELAPLVSNMKGVLKMQMRIEDWIVITDLDGTIIDSESTNFRILNRILEEFSLTEHRTTIMRGLGDGKEFDEIMRIIEINLFVLLLKKLKKTKKYPTSLEKLLVKLFMKLKGVLEERVNFHYV